MPTSSKEDPSLHLRLRADQSDRWQKGERVQVEHYLAQYPGLLSDGEALLDLIHAEILLREQLGDTPRLEEYIDRFPAQARQLQEQWKLHRLMFQRDRVEGDPDSTGPDARTAPAGRRSPGPLPSLPGFEILEELGRGGMGVVFKARQIDLDRIVAVKLIRTGPLAGTEEMERFRTEARAIARLSHPGVVQVFSFGQEENVLFLVMEYLPGGSLARRLAGRPLDPREAVVLIRDLARAVHAAHEARVVHRDLKPGNVLLDGDGKARVSDFGLARLLDADVSQTASEMVLGTPDYMAPEQAAGRTREVGPPADVHALGAILYECLTGSPPFRSRTRAETLRRVQEHEPVPLRRSCPSLSVELEAICLACLEKIPSRRYPSARALADDLDSWLDGRPPRVRPRGRLARTVRGLRRHSRIVLSLVLAVLMAPVAWVMMQPADPERPLRELERELSHQKRVVVLGEQGAPPWSAWALNPATQFLSEDGHFSLESRAISLLELVRDPQMERYRYHALIRHEKGTVGFVGLYVGRDYFPLEGGPGAFSVRATFDDVSNEGERIRNARIRAKAPMPRGPLLNRVSVDLALHTPLENRVVGDQPGPCFEKRIFEPNKPGTPPRWRWLTLEVSPERIVVAMDGTAVGQMTTREIMSRVPEIWGHVLRRHPALAGSTVPTRFNSRGGLGLVVIDSVASFKDVVIEPIDS